MPKILIIAPARAGKDTFAEMLGLSYASSSEFALKEFMFDQLNLYRRAASVSEYQSIEEAMADRFHHRKLWYHLIRAYNHFDRAALAKALLAKHDVYVGMRDLQEFEACIGEDLFDHIIYIDRPGCAPDETFELSPAFADIRVLNSWGLDELREAAEAVKSNVLQSTESIEETKPQRSLH